MHLRDPALVRIALQTPLDEVLMLLPGLSGTPCILPVGYCKVKGWFLIPALCYYVKELCRNLIFVHCLKWLITLPVLLYFSSYWYCSNICFLMILLFGLILLLNLTVNITAYDANSLDVLFCLFFVADNTERILPSKWTLIRIAA